MSTTPFAAPPGRWTAPLVLPGLAVDSTFVTGVRAAQAVSPGTSRLRFTGVATGPRHIASIVCPGALDGQILVIENDGGGALAAITLDQISTTVGTAGGLITSTSATSGPFGGVVIPGHGRAILVYDATGFPGIGPVWLAATEPPVDALARQPAAQRNALSVDARLNKSWYWPAVGTVGITATAAGGGSLTFPGTFRGGVGRLQTSAAAGGTEIVGDGDGVNRVALATNLRTDPWYAQARIQIPTIDANTVMRFFFIDAGLGNFFGVQVRGAAGTIEWNNNGAITGTGQPFSPTGFHDLAFYSDGTTALIALDGGVLAATPFTTATIAALIGSAVPANLIIQIQNNAVATNEIVDVSDMFCATVPP